jgi:hypothetical protein
MAAQGITMGCNPPTNDMFCPDSVVTRGQMAAFLVRALDLTDRLDDPFVDDDDSIFEADIERLAAAGITKGCNPAEGNTKFCPDEKVTREQMAAFLVRALNYTDDGGGDLFIDDDGSVFEPEIDRLGTAGVTKGCNPPANDRYCPESLVSRAQMASFLTRALGLVPMVPPTGFIGMFEGFQNLGDNSFVTVDFGPTGSDRTVGVEVFDEGGTVCLNTFGEFSPVSATGIGTRVDPTHIDITYDELVCHTSGGDQVVPSEFNEVFEYDPVTDVVWTFGCYWRSEGGTAADC